MDLTCKQLVANLHETIWLVFWLAIAVHIFLGLAIPAIRFGINYLRLYLKQNLQDHAEIGQMIKRNQP